MEDRGRINLIDHRLAARLGEWAGHARALMRRSGIELPARVRILLVSAYILAVSAVVLLKLHDWSYDDVYITYRYADNLYRNVGFVYNPGEQILSTTTPLFAMLLALLEHISTDAPHVANIIGALSIAAGSLALWSLAQGWSTPWVGRAGLLLYPTFPLLLSTLSSEMPLYLAFCVGAFACYARKRFRLAAICAALAVLTRGDGMLVAMVLGADYLVRYRRPVPWIALTLFLAPLALWTAFALSYFGSPLPATLSAKQLQGAMLISERFAPGFLTLARDYVTSWAFVVQGALFAVGLVSVIRSNPAWRPFLLWTVLYFGAYAGLGVSSYFWYYAPLVPAFVVAVGLGLGWVAAHVTWPRSTAPLVPIAVLLVLAVMQVQPLLSRDPYFVDSRTAIYRTAGEWLAAHTGSDAVVGTLEVGVIGYYSNRRMIDFAGLLEPAVASRLTPASTYADTTVWAIQQYRPDHLVVLDSQWAYLAPAAPSCSPVQTFAGSDYGYSGNLDILQCNW